MGKQGWCWGLARGALAGVLAASALGLGCGSSAGGGPGPQPASGGNASSGGAGGSSAAGAGSASCRGADCLTGGSIGASDGPAAAKACRDYVTAVCARVRECGAPAFRPCESPIDACPDILFVDGSAWTVPQVVACTEDWKTHDCAALATDQGPACSEVLGARPAGNQCVFDAQCQSGHCNGGIVPSYDPSCGKCADRAPSHGACDELHVCPSVESCQNGTCIDAPPQSGTSCVGVACPDGQSCIRDRCVPDVPLAGTCSYDAPCAPGLGCQIEIVSDPELVQMVGTCQPLPAIGTPCLPTFGSIGICVAGGTCTGRPTGDCVPLVAIGESCGFTQCVAGAYCQVWNYQSLPSHTCYALGKEGDVCPHEGSDLGLHACVPGLDCLCATPDCGVAGTCLQGRARGQSCNGTTEQCKADLACQAGLCVDINSDPNALPAGSPCSRSTAYGRESGNCVTDHDCLCPDAACTAPLCAKPRDLGDTCAPPGELCRQGLACTQGVCVAVTDRDFEAQSCTP